MMSKKISVILVCLISIFIVNCCTAKIEVKNEYYSSGKLKSETPFKDGKREGIAKFYDEDGKLVTELIYKDGYLINIKDYRY